ncbi:hypothetical protein [Aporhodopirellula aestuarii]|uniref:Uncharacterized protein n=1 Tax=Aporhodopirellula aestuarii TaxID=2950107 RepID=A0ABT0U5C5_9BACT|nr:hypothetical protein [Aporhodopirellula aestuarii]MCM2372142.1 hypothetical protein [Aporhodopirellula aestuarii]
MSLAVGSFAESPSDVEVEQWRSQKLQTLATKIRNTNSDDERLEYSARQSWLRRWEPGQMPTAPADAPDESGLVEEPLLKKLERPETLEANVWRGMIALQTRLLEVDNDDERKDNLRTTIELSGQLEAALSTELPSDSQTLATPTSWVLAYTRYRLGRALAYRELPEVAEVWPISDPDRYEEQLLCVYERLIEQTKGNRREFILLQDRMYRRSGKKGRALELLEANRQSIDPKWYLKKRRDLLQELGWEPPYQEAARLYLQAGYDDES